MMTQVRPPPPHHLLPAIGLQFGRQRWLLSGAAPGAAGPDLQAEQEGRGPLHQLLQLRHRSVDQRLHDGGQLSVQGRRGAHPVRYQPPPLPLNKAANYG